MFEFNIHVEPIISPRSGEAVRNQYTIKTPTLICFQSYDSLIAVYDIEHEVLTLGYHFDYSRTTSKYLHEWLKEYCPRIYNYLPKGKSLKDTLYKAIEAGMIFYNEDMI